MSFDYETRIAAFEWLKGQTGIHGDVLPRRLLEKGFVEFGQRIPLMSPQGIFRPKRLDYPLTITTAPEGPYDDRISTDGLLSYRYRGSDPSHRDNIGLRKAMRDKGASDLPLRGGSGQVHGSLARVHRGRRSGKPHVHGCCG